ALFAFLSNYPLATFLSGLAVLLVVIFFTTSVDSAAMVVDMIASGKDDDVQVSPTHQRVIWGVLMGAVGATLLAFTGEGGLTALQEVITVIGLPFFVMGFVMMYSLVRGITNDLGERPPTVTRQWQRAYSAEALEENECLPSPEPVHPLNQIPDEEEDDGAPGPGGDAAAAARGHACGVAGDERPLALQLRRAERDVQVHVRRVREDDGPSGPQSRGQECGGAVPDPGRRPVGVEVLPSGDDDEVVG